jgi:hypothetical protein
MVQNVEQILSRGERIELLVDKTDAMAGQANQFRRGARAARRQMWWKNTKLLILCFFVAIVSSYSLVEIRGVGANGGIPGSHVDLRCAVLWRGTEPVRDWQEVIVLRSVGNDTMNMLPYYCVHY